VSDKPVGGVGAALPEVAVIEKNVGVPEGFCSHLLHNDDDWAFVIKLTALLDTVLFRALCARIAEPRLERLLEDLKIGQKLPLAKAFALFNDGQAAYVNALSKMRNHFAHDPTRAGSTIKGYVASLEPSDASNVVRNLTLSTLTLEDLMGGGAQTCKLMVWTSGIAVLLALAVEESTAAKGPLPPT
jgi:hypothetical protein